MNKETFLNYLYSNNYNNVYEHALNICNTWGLGYAISNIGEKLQVNEKTMYDIYKEGELSINNDINIIGCTIEEQTMMQEGTSAIYFDKHDQIITNKTYNLIQFYVKYIKENDVMTEDTDYIYERYSIGIGLMSLTDLITTTNPIRNCPTANITSELGSILYPYGRSEGNNNKGIIFPYFNYESKWITPINESTIETPTQLYDEIIDTTYLNPAAVRFISKYIYLIDKKNHKIYTAVDIGGNIKNGQTINNITLTGPQILIQYISPNENIILPYTIQYEIHCINVVNTNLENWLKTIKI